MEQVQKIKFKGTEIPFRITYSAMLAWSKETGLTLNDLDKLDSDLEMLEPLFWHSLVAGYKYLDTINPYTRETSIEIIDEVWLMFIQKMGVFFLTGVSLK